MNILKTFGSAEISLILILELSVNVFEIDGRANRISLTPERLKERARSSIGISSIAGSYSNQTFIRSNRTHRRAII